MADNYLTSSDDDLMSSNDEDEFPTSEFEVSSLVDICYSDPTRTGKRGLMFLVKYLPLSSGT